MNTTTTKIIKTNNNTNMSKSAMRKQRLVNNIVSATLANNNRAITSIRTNPVQLISAKTLKNRRKRANRKRLMTSTPNLQNYYGRYAGNFGLDPTMLDSVYKLVQSQFYPQKGVHRGLALGMDTSAICLYEGSVNMTPSVGSQVLAFAYCPDSYTNNSTTSTKDTPGFLQYTTNTLDPFGTGQIVVAGPFATNNPQVSGRVVSATLNIIPSGSLLNRSGEGKLGYTPNLANLIFGVSARTSIDNLSISRSWDGTEGMSLHWTPNDGEYSIHGSATTQPSSIVGYLQFPATVAGSAISFRLEYQVAIEYEPNNTFKPLVDRKAPEIRPDARYFLNKVIMQNWDPLMISSFKSYESRLAMNNVGISGHAVWQGITHAGLSGHGFRNPIDAQIIEEGIAELDEPSSTYEVIKDFACTTGETITGQPFCTAPLKAGLNTIRNFRAAQQRAEAFAILN